MKILEMPRSEYPQASLTLTKAFFDYPDLSYYFPDPNKRHAQLKWMLLSGLVHAGRIGKVLTTEDRLGSMTLLLPGARNLNFWDFLASGHLMAPLKMSRESLKKMQFCETYTMHIHHELMVGRPHFYIWYLGVDPNAQGKGLGTALILHVQTLAKLEHKPIYLETHTIPNVTYYEHLGFRALAENKIPDHPIRFYNMLWEPKEA